MSDCRYKHDLCPVCENPDCEGCDNPDSEPYCCKTCGSPDCEGCAESNYGEWETC